MAYEDTLTSVSLDADSSIGFYTHIAGQPPTVAGEPSPDVSKSLGMQYRFVKVTGKRTVGLAVAGTDTIVGVLQNKPQTVGAAATVGINGISMVEAGAAVTEGSLVTADSTGRAVDAAGGTAAGVALDGAGAAGHIIPVLLFTS